MFDAIKEVLREERTGDVKFLQDLVYYFELRVPEKMVSGRSPTFLFPLVLGPESITLSEPFALTKTQTQGSGLFVEENGIIERSLYLRGHTGWRPRPFKGSTGFGAIRAPETGRSFSREIVDPILDSISGQKHFQFLQDAVFRTYGDLKRDPSSSEDTRLFFHNPREDEHWEVKPVSFKLDRSLEKRNLYYYDIELLLVGPSKDADHDFSEDKSLLDTIKDSVRMIQSGIDLVRSAVTDLTNLVNEIAGTVKGIVGILNDAVSLIDAASDFVNGVSNLIAAPFEATADLINHLDDALVQIANSGRSFPAATVNSLRQIQAGIDRLGSFPEVFQTDSQRALESIRRGQELSSSRSLSTLQAAAALSPPNSFQKVLAMGTANLPGDLLKSRSELHINKALAVYQSTEERRIGQSDTLQSLAAHYLGDARLYQHIAVLNGLQYPFISREGLPGTKRPGDSILIPSRARAPRARTLVSVLGVAPDATAEERILGTDLMMERVDGAGDLFDFVIDVEGGSVDLKTVSGVKNLQQALLARLRTERGTDQLNRNLGVDRIIGIGIPALGPQIVAIRVAEAVRADPRIAGVRRLDVSQPTPDSVVIDFDAEIIGISGTTPVNLTF